MLSVASVSVEYATKEGSVKALRHVSFDIQPGEVFGLAGESGSGKSTLARAILRALDDNGSQTSGSIQYKGEDLQNLSPNALRSLRGSDIAFVPQEPAKALNPSIEVGEQIAETIREHQNLSESEVQSQTIEMLRQVNISDPDYCAESYPHELSGGMKQRVAFAIGLSCNPDLLILDEPTTGLDVTTEGKVLQMIDDLIEEFETSILFVTHNLGVLAEKADRVGILYAGEIMEIGATKDVFTNPSNPYTQGLLAAVPDIDRDVEIEAIPGEVPDLSAAPTGCVFADRCEFATEECHEGSIDLETVTPGHETRCRRLETVQSDPIQAELRDARTNYSGSKILEVTNLKKYYGQSSFVDRLFGSESPVKAVDGVSFDIHESETLGIVGESGCGKSTLARTLLQLLEPTAGEIRFRGESIDMIGSRTLPQLAASQSKMADFRKEVQVVFQDPESSLNPSNTVYETLERPLELFTDLTQEERENRIEEIIQQVDLGITYLDRHPHELSGGEKQRVAIARAFAGNPSLVILDEPVSALDVSVQASIINLLRELREEYGTSYLLISHNLGVINEICERVAVMYLGEFVEMGTTEEIFQPPYHPYTRALLTNIPTTEMDTADRRVYLEGDVPSARDPPVGCSFHSRCPQKIGDICECERPELEQAADSDTHTVACHLDEKEMMVPLAEDIEESDR
ncbi:ABC transporter ATP-binding protein [Halonotius pteroides]|uniref:Nickel import system ATP-binding protein NikD n=1 Tax=Halonotius pteroides TaxID=268735 RepID=A0A3A6PW56_9EURY|nr:ABC transporter ATP-binding protein [Halonotius pteroides]